jgi:MYXO-CTERM domain-containing protein
MRRTWIGALAWCWTLAGPAIAAQQPLTAEQIEAMAEWVVDGEVTAVEVRWSGDRDEGIETVAWVAVEQTRRGAPVDTLAVVLAGGRIDDHGTWVADEAVLLADHRYRLTLVRDGRGRLRVLGGAAGAVPLDPMPCYGLTGSDWAHQSHPVEEDFRINAGTFDDGMVSDEQLEDAYRMALDLWNVEGGAGVYLPYGGTTSNSQYGSDNGVNAALFHSFSWGSTLALATWNYSGNGQMTDCDIRFYGSNGSGAIHWSFDVDNGASGGEYDFVQVAEHEMGHCLGLDHSSHATAVMYASSSPGSGWERRHLHSDDEAGLQAIYGSADVDLVVDARWFEVASGLDDGDDALDPGEVHELHVAMRNQGNALAAEVEGTLLADGGEIDFDGGAIVLGDLPPGSNSGSDEDHLVFALSTRPGCDEDGTATLHVDVEELAGNQWTTDSWTLEYQCGGPLGDDDDDGEADDDDGGSGRRRGGGDGCSCRTSGDGTSGSVMTLALGLVLFLVRRR